MKEYPSEIIPNLWVGSLLSLSNTDFKSTIKINTIINTEKDLHYLGKHKEYNEPLQKNFKVFEINKLDEYLDECTNFININLNNNNTIFVVCNNGIQKSPTIILSYLIRYGKLSIESGLKCIRTKNTDVFFPTIEFIFSLKRFYEKYNKISL